MELGFCMDKFSPHNVYKQQSIFFGQSHKWNNCLNSIATTEIRLLPFITRLYI